MATCCSISRTGCLMRDARAAADCERRLVWKCEGALARLLGLPSVANPFPIGTSASSDWLRGWDRPDFPQQGEAA